MQVKITAVNAYVCCIACAMCNGRGGCGCQWYLSLLPCTLLPPALSPPPPNPPWETAAAAPAGVATPRLYSTQWRRSKAAATSSRDMQVGIVQGTRGGTAVVQNSPGAMLSLHLCHTTGKFYMFGMRLDLAYREAYAVPSNIEPLDVN